MFISKGGDYSKFTESLYKTYPYVMFSAGIIYFFGSTHTLKDRKSVTAENDIEKRKQMIKIVLYNYLAFFIPFFIGCHWFYLQRYFNIFTN